MAHVKDAEGKELSKDQVEEVVDATGEPATQTNRGQGEAINQGQNNGDQGDNGEQGPQPTAGGIEVQDAAKGALKIGGRRYSRGSSPLTPRTAAAAKTQAEVIASAVSSQLAPVTEAFQTMATTLAGQQSSITAIQKDLEATKTQVQELMANPPSQKPSSQSAFTIPTVSGTTGTQGSRSSFVSQGIAHVENVEHLKTLKLKADIIKSTPISRVHLSGEYKESALIWDQFEAETVDEDTAQRAIEESVSSITLSTIAETKFSSHLGGATFEDILKRLAKCYAECHVAMPSSGPAYVALKRSLTALVYAKDAGSQKLLRNAYPKKFARMVGCLILQCAIHLARCGDGNPDALNEAVDRFVVNPNACLLKQDEFTRFLNAFQSSEAGDAETSGAVASEPPKAADQQVLDHLTKINSTLEQVQKDQATMKTTMGRVKTEVAEAKTDIVEIKASAVSRPGNTEPAPTTKKGEKK